MIYAMIRSTVLDYRVLDEEMPGKRFEAHENVISKRPLDIFYQFDPPRPRLVMIRDVRSVITSIHWKHPGKYFVGADRCLEQTPGVISQWNAIRLLRDDPINLVLKYEDVTADPEWAQAQIGMHFGLEFEGRFSDFADSDIPEGLERPLNGKRPVDSGHDWRKHLPRVKEQFRAHPELFDILIDSGYETGREWYGEL